ncbi:Crotonobetainyl-CoA:carnitine CoA-transferase CaiB [Variovorax sp. YR750]|uniref:CaiB/BaiF CoA transferase family protein n=1 Tax=Variovorax sp. YR750 TaxID=1884384 RepID=UPI0008C6C492|nr:CoA transferase [Variovorax sp. YR750]SEM06032.1 Crotonobetainyl-CoA:carnitine CoA-transferase CaiB [Variovorax sp. YR750]
MKHNDENDDARLPLAGLKVLDFGHTVMAPTCGLILADLGAEVVRIERVEGDPTRSLKGFGSGFFGYLNRNKESVAIDLKNPLSRPALERALQWADVVIENFGPEVMERLGYGYAQASTINPRLVYCSLKGFLPGPYQARPALDEVVQMMGGLAYMTGPAGQPIRAGASIVDMTGGMFGVIGITAALRARETTGRGAFITSALYETTAFLVGQHMAMAQFGDTPVVPMPARTQAWCLYDLCQCADGQMFIGITSDAQWKRFCIAFGLEELLDDPRLADNTSRTRERPWLLPRLNEMFAKLSMATLEALCKKAEIPFGPVRTPLDLLDDEHLRANGSLLEVTVGDRSASVPAMPFRIDGHSPAVRLQPQDVGAQTAKYLRAWGLTDAEANDLFSRNAVAGPH